MRTDDKPGGVALLAGRPVARIGFGAMQLVAHRPGQTAVDRDTSITVLRNVVHSGVNHIDTAQFYGDGACNAVIRDALAPFPEDLVLVSKVGAVNEPGGGLIAAQRPEQLRAQVDANLATLGIDHLPVVNLRRLDNPPGIRAEGDQLVDLDSQLAELLALRAEGKIGAIGLSAVTVEQLRQALAADIECVQNAHNPLDRASEPVLDVCREHDIAWVPFFPLGSAFPGFPKATEHPTVIAAAAAVLATPAQVCLAWHLAHYVRTLLIAGSVNPDHLADNIAAGRITLDADTMSALDQLAAIPGS
ncbi:aldo/keto reductase [Nocardia sp. NBC_01499]|uniref:aldo/keto reductase n=1 Tax=Nocardia sp. NBC_01499 TaxID=2903597 RepID=UPI0038667E4E